MRNKKPIIIGFCKFKDRSEYQHCPTHSGVRLILTENEGIYLCPLGCGSVNSNETLSDTKISSRFATVPNSKKIVSGHKRSYKKKEYHDSFGNKIPSSDLDAVKDIAQGHTIVHYKETVYDDFKDRNTRTRKDGKDVYTVIR